MSIGLKANKEKIGSLLEYVSYKIPNIELRKLLKIIYLVDEESVKRRAFPITWLDYYAWEKGPVAPEVYDIKNGAFPEYVNCTKNDSGKWIVNSVSQAEYPIARNMKVMSENERTLINSVLDKYGNFSSDELTEVTHKMDTLWSRTVSQNNICFADSAKSDVLIDLNILNEGNEENQEVFEEAFDAVQIQAFLNS